LVAPTNLSNSPGLGDAESTTAAGANGSFAITWKSQGDVVNDENLAIYQFVDPSPPPPPTGFRPILEPITIDPSGVIDVPHITALSNGSFALTYTDVFSTNSTVWQVFDAQGQLVTGGTAMPATFPQFEELPDVAALPGGGFALVWEEGYVGGTFTQT